MHVQKRPCVQPKYFMAPNLHSRQCTMNHREVRQSENPTNISILEKKPCDSMSAGKLSTDCDRVICSPLKIQTLPSSQAVELYGPDMARALDVCQEAYTVRICAKSNIVEKHDHQGVTFAHSCAPLISLQLLLEYKHISCSF